MPNEIHIEWTACGDVPQARCDTIANLNQAFVDTVRAAGERNATRMRIVPGYNTTDYRIDDIALP